MKKTVTDPFPSGCLGIDKFRIPSLFVTRENTLLAACDARWNHGQDCAGNLETVLARSEDGGQTWEHQFVNYFEDVTDGSDRCIFSAGFIDPIIAQDSQGILYLLVDLCPPYVGAWGRPAVICGQADGFHKKGLALKKSSGAAGPEPEEWSEETYPYYLGEPQDGYARVLQVQDDAPYEDYAADQEFYLYRLRPDGPEKVMIPQLNEAGEPTDRLIHANIFFAAAPLKVYPTFHIVCRTSADDGRTWSPMRMVSGQIESPGFTAVCPGRGQIWTDGTKERVLIPIYDNNLKSEYASVLYTEDQGRTWHRSSRAKSPETMENNDPVKSSETQIVTLPDGTLRMYSRSQIREIVYADSKDGGETWTPCRRDPGLVSCGNCMVSVINYSRRIEGRPALIASYPGGDDTVYRRVNGIIAVGLIDEATNEVDWKYHYAVNQAPFYYSCLTELPDGAIALFYEYDEFALHLKTYTIETLTT